MSSRWDILKFVIIGFGVAVVLLLGLGVVFVYSATIYRYGERYLWLQTVWCILGVLAMSIGALLDYRWLKRVAVPMYILAILLLILVLIPGLGIEVNGARRWLGNKSFRFQPSELGKLSLIVVLSWYCARNVFLLRQGGRGLVIGGILVGLMSGLVFVEPDRGTALLLLVTAMGLFWMAGIRLRYLIYAGLLAGLLIGSLLWHDPTIVNRVKAKLTKTEEGAGYQQAQSRLAIASGGIWGKGWHNGRQKLGFVPEIHTDFILSVIGEEWGLMGISLVVLLYMTVVCSGLYIASRAVDVFGMLLVFGIMFLVGVQALVNLGVALDMLPAKGFPLPFVSYGGSSILMTCVMAGLVLSVGRVALSERDTVIVSVQGRMIGEELARQPEPERAHVAFFVAPAVEDTKQEGSG